MLEDITLFNVDVSNFTKNDLRDYLKKDASTLGIYEIMSATNAIREDSKYIQTIYRERYIQSYMDSFIKKIKEIKDDKINYDNDLDINKLKEGLLFLKDKQDTISLEEIIDPNFNKICILTSIYSTFLKKEPIHCVGTPFPGGFEVIKEGSNYYCPVKDKQKTSDRAICLLCIAKQDPNFDL